MSNYIVTDSELTSVANAIRTKGGTNGSLVFPGGFTSAISNISSGESFATLILAEEWSEEEQATIITSSMTPEEIKAVIDANNPILLKFIPDNDDYSRRKQIQLVDSFGFNTLGDSVTGCNTAIYDIVNYQGSLIMVEYAIAYSYGDWSVNNTIFTLQTT